MKRNRPMPAIRIAVVYRSGYGHTRRQAEAVRCGVEQVEGAEAVLLSVEEAQARWADLASAEAIISARRHTPAALRPSSKHSRTPARTRS